MKTAGDVLTYVKRQFGDEAGVQITDADIYRWINLGQLEIVNKNPILKVTATTDVLEGVYKYNFESLNILKVEALHYNGAQLAFKNFSEYQEYIAKEDPQREQTGRPILWYEWGGTFHLYPTPDTTETGALTVYYVKMPTDVITSTDAISIPDRYFNALLQFVMAQAYELDEDWNSSGAKNSQFEAGLMGLSEAENPHAHVYPVITVLDEDMY